MILFVFVFLLLGFCLMFQVPMNIYYLFFTPFSVYLYKKRYHNNLGKEYVVLRSSLSRKWPGFSEAPFKTLEVIFFCYSNL